MGLDAEAVRAATLATSSIVHANNAGCSLPAPPVTDAIVQHLALEAQKGGYEAESSASVALEEVYLNVARLLNCEANQIAFFGSATIAWMTAFNAVPLQRGDRILIDSQCYGSNYIALLNAVRMYGVHLEVIPADRCGQVDLSQLRALTGRQVRLIAITHVPANGGLIQPIEDIGKIAREADALFFVDGCQSVGQLPIDVQQIGCDVLTFTGRKYLRGPRGTGGLFIRSECLDILKLAAHDSAIAQISGTRRRGLGDEAKTLETRERSIALQLGLGAAVSYALRLGVEDTWPLVVANSETLRSYLQPIPGVVLLDNGSRRCGIVSFALRNVSPRCVKRELRKRHINVGVTTWRQTPIEMRERRLSEILRASVHYYNNNNDAVQVAEAIADIAFQQARGG